MKIYGIGVGPGDPELLTVKAVRILVDSDVVVVPQSDKTGRSIAGDIVKHYVPESKIHWYFFPMTGVKSDLAVRYDELAEAMKNYLAIGKKVAYVTIGDTPVFSTFNYLRNRLINMDIEMEMIPGISAFSAGANQQSLPLCEKGESFCVIEMPETAEEISKYLQDFTTVILMKVHKKLHILKELISSASLSEAYLFNRVSLPDGKTYNLLTDNVDDEKAGYLSTAIIKRG